MSDKDQVLGVHALNAGYGPIHVLWDVTFTWTSDRNILRLTGANGSGRTTLMRVLSGLLRPTSGTVELGGRDITFASPQERYDDGMTLVPEGRELFVGLTVEENLKVGLKVARQWPQVRDEVLDVFPKLKELLKRRVESLSGGQQQMVAVARGMASRPRVLLLDEPYAGLAPRIVEDIEQATEQLAAQGTYVLVVEEKRTATFEVGGLELRRGRVSIEERTETDA